MTSAKAQLRATIRRILREISPTQIADFSRELRQKLRFPPGSKVALFAGTATEPWLLDLLTEQPETTWFLPKVTGPGEMDFIHTRLTDSLRKGPLGILEPIDGAKAESLDWVVCPGLAFTPDGKRLGQGGGFYDRALLRFPEARTMGVAFPCQIFDDLPFEEHDRKVDRVLTPCPAPSGETPEY